jgi:tight adherence protein C
MEIAIATLAFLAVTLTTWVLFRPRENIVARRIRGGSSVPMTTERRLNASPGERLIGPAALRIGRILASLLPSRLVQPIERMLVMSNSRLTLQQFLGMWSASIVLGVVFCFYMARPGTRLSPLVLTLTITAIAFAFGAGPYVLLRRRVRNRQRAITRGLPYALDLLITCIEAGLGVDAAIATVTEKTSGPIADTFAAYLRGVGLGRSRRDALMEVAERSGVPDLIGLAASVAQAEQMGATIGDVLRVQARELRVVHRQRVEAAAQRAPVLMTIPLAICFMPAMVAVTAVPAGLHLMSYIANLGSLGR